MGEFERTQQPKEGIVMYPCTIPSPGPIQGPVARPIPRRRFTVLDAMILTGALAIACWSGLQELVWSLDPHLYGPQPWSWPRLARITLKRTAPFASVVTMALLFLRLLQPRPSVSRLARQPGFVACLAAPLVLFVGGSMTFSGVSRNIYLPWRGLHFTDYFPYLFQPFERAEVGFAVAASWLVLIVGRRWRPEPSWIDRCGRAAGAYWIMLVPIVRIGETLNL
jgi:hypothetical protein